MTREDKKHALGLTQAMRWPAFSLRSFSLSLEGVSGEFCGHQESTGPVSTRQLLLAVLEA